MCFKISITLFAAILTLMPAPTLIHAATSVSTPLLEAYALMPKLQKGGLVIVMRHQRAAISGRWDDFTRPWTECSAQRNLSVAGYAGSIETGQAFRILNIPFGKVLASPMCRTMETARLIFDHVEAREELGHASEARNRTKEMTSKELKKTVAALTPKVNNDVLITHGGNIYFAYNHSLTEGDMLFFEQASGKAILIGKASAADFDLLANAKLVKDQKPPLATD